jgi:serine phosphatase RsbU (regulator of sigma subunit)
VFKKLSIVLLLLAALAGKAQYLSPECYVINNLSFTGKGLSKMLNTPVTTGNFDSQLKQLAQQMDKIKEDTLNPEDKTTLHLFKSAYYCLKSNPKKALENAIVAQSLAQKINNRSMEELSLLLQSGVYYKLNSFKNSSYLSKQEVGNKDINFQLGYINAFSLFQLNDFDGSDAACMNLKKNPLKLYDYYQVNKLHAIALEKQRNFILALTLTNRNDSILNELKKQSFTQVTSPSLAYSDLSPQVYNEKLFTETLIIKNNLGFLLLKSNKLNEAEETFKEAIAIAKAGKQKTFQYQLEKNIGLTFTLLKQYGKAEDHYKAAEEICAKNSDTKQGSEILWIRAKNQYLSNNLEEARLLCEKSISMAKQGNFYDQLSESYSLMVEINAYNGDIQTANYYSNLAQEASEKFIYRYNESDAENLANELKEEVSNTVFAREKAELELIQLKLEATKKEHEIELIKKENQIKEARFFAQKLASEKSKQDFVMVKQELDVMNQLKELERVKKERRLRRLENKNNEAQIKWLNEKRKIDEALKTKTKKEYKMAKENERMMRWFLIAALIVMCVVGVLLYINIKNARVIKLTNAKLEKLTVDLQSSNDTLTETLIQVNKQAEIIEAKNLQIYESIHYAQRIQEASLPKKDEIEKLAKHAFVMFQPKDIISGDFYVVSQIKTTQNRELDVFVVADCTGHGVPGAMLSLLCSSLLRYAFKQRGVDSPADVLDFVNTQLKNFFRSKEEDSFKDGMDIACAMLDREASTLYFAGAGRPLVHVSNGVANELKGEKQHIGFSTQTVPFTNLSIPVTKGDFIYLFSDGYTDQFGGENNKRFMTKNLKELMASIYVKNMEEQQKIMEEVFQKWKGNNIQMDDVCVLGIGI